MFPQTWEDPDFEHPVTKCSGDNDPVDVVEIGTETLAQGAVEPVKVLGVLAMIDDGELDGVIVVGELDIVSAKRTADDSELFTDTLTRGSGDEMIVGPAGTNDVFGTEFMGIGDTSI